MALGWLWWRAWVKASRRGRRGCWRGRRGTLWLRPSLCVVGVALCDIDLNFVWQAWHLLTHTTCSHTTCTHTHNLLTHNLLTHNLLTYNLLTRDLHTHDLLTHNLLTYNLLTYNLLTHDLHTHDLHTHTTYSRTTDMDRRFAWQAWHLWHWAGSGDALG